MTLNYYQKPEIELCRLSAKVPYLYGIGEGTTGTQLVNRHHWEDDQLGEGLDDSPYALTAPSLWEE